MRLLWHRAELILEINSQLHRTQPFAFAAGLISVRGTLNSPSPSLPSRCLCYDKAIMPKQLIMRILGAAIVLIALSFAPSVAQAHPGHQQHASSDGGQGHDAPQATSHQSDGTATAASLQQAPWNQAGKLPSSDRNCAGGCCSSACTACCVTGLPTGLALVPYPRSTARVGFVPSQIWPDREPELLRRPPKYFI